MDRNMAVRQQEWNMVIGNVQMELLPYAASPLRDSYKSMCNVTQLSFDIARPDLTPCYCKQHATDKDKTSNAGHVGMQEINWYI